MAAVEKSQVAAFIDFENVVIAAEKEHGEFRLNAILEAIGQQGRLVVKRAYGDWSRFYKYQSDLTQNAVDLIQLYSMRAGSTKNAADIQIAIDAMEVIFTHPKVEVFAIVSGDSDFTALVRKLKNYGKYVIGVGLRSSTSELLVRACDEFLLYENLVGKSSRTVAFDKERARDVLARALRQLLSDGQTDVPTVRVKQTILSLDPTFDEVNLGYKQFEDFLAAQGDLLDLNECGLRPAIVKLRGEQVKPEALYPTDGRNSLAVQYRDGLMSSGLALVDPETRQAILRDLYQPLEKNPARLTLNESEQMLKQQYDADNILRSREVVREVVKLAARSAALQFASGVPALGAAVSLLPGISQQRFIDRAEATYIKSLMDQNLIDPDQPDDKAIAGVLFGTVDEALRVATLRKELDMIRGEFQELITGPILESPLVELLGRETLHPVFRDMTEFKLDEPPSLFKATELVNQGMSVRLRDFSAGAELFLKASVMQKLLIEQGEPGAGVDDAEWYMASYCSARAGQYFFSHDYDAARQYYLGFFAISQDTEPFYAKVKNLTRPMLSYYFTIAANEHGVLLDRSPSQIAPARMAVILCTHEDSRVQRAWRELARDLSQVNRGIINLLIEELDVVERNPAEIDQARVYLSSLLV
jgi:uncharacterized protein (TIGR00288 family)